jgi:hypothetical protein
MKHILLSTTLVCVTAPAFAGTLLEDALGGHEYTSASHEVSDGVETYTDFSMEASGTRFSAAALSIATDGETVSVDMSDVDISEFGDEMFTAQSLQLNYGVDAMTGVDIAKKADALFDMVDEGLLEPDTCLSMDMPFDLVAGDVVYTDITGDTLTVKEVAVSYDIEDPAAACVVNIDFAATDLSATVGPGITMSVASAGMYVSSPTGTIADAIDPDAKYGGAFELSDIVFDMNGAEQVVIDLIASQAETNGASTAAMIGSGYYDILDTIAITGDLPGRDIMTGEKMIEIWDAFRSLESTTEFVIDGARITGDT